MQKWCAPLSVWHGCRPSVEGYLTNSFGVKLTALKNVTIKTIYPNSELAMHFRIFTASEEIGYKRKIYCLLRAPI